MPVWQWLLDAAGVLLALVLALRHRPDRAPPRAVAQRRHLRAQLPHPLRPRPAAAGCSGSAATPATPSSGSGSSPSRRDPSGSWQRGQICLRRTSRPVGGRADVAVRRPRRGLVLHPGGPLELAMEPGVADRVPVLARGRSAGQGTSPVTLALARPAAQRGRVVLLPQRLCASRRGSPASRRRGPGFDLVQRRARPPAAGDRDRVALALPTTGAAIAAFGTVRVVRLGALAASVGLAAAAVGLGNLLPLTAAGLFVYGLGIGVWDVAMNVEGAEVERHLGRTIMPRFHAGFSLGTVVGARIGAGLVAARRPVRPCTCRRWPSWRSRSSGAPPRPSCRSPTPDTRSDPALSVPGSSHAPSSIGVMVLALALTEGTANDWLAVALVDGYDVSHSVGVAGFALFVAAMTACRFVGTGLIDRFGRVGVLWVDDGRCRRRRAAHRLRRAPGPRHARHRPLGCGCRARLPGRA